MDFFKYLSDHFQATYWIPGNHEYYYSDITERCGVLHEEITNHVFLVNNISINHEKIKFIFSTLWGKINPANAWYIRKGMSDFKVIKHKDEIFSPDQFNQLHEESLNFLEKELFTNSGKTIVVSHHVPTFFNYPPQYKGNILNEAFAVELFNLIERIGPNYWIFRHTHTNVEDFNIGKTQLKTNQLGYVKYNEQKAFDAGRFIEI
jgi:predicted phosphohydrolase